MSKFIAVLACACAVFLPAGSAGATSFGVADDMGKYAFDGGASFFAQLHDVGLTSNRIVITWDPSTPGGSPDLAYIGRALPASTLFGVKLVLAVYPLRAKGITGSPGTEEQFANFLAQLARTYPQIKDYIVGNEPNQPRFWQPQFNPDGSPASPAAYESLLARSYDALKGVDPSIIVAGLGVSPRGNDDPNAKDNVSISPVRFIRELGRTYRASGRTRPIMDQLSFHPYPNSPTDGLDKGYQWPKAGVANLDRIKQAVWDAFSGTAQPVFQEGEAALASTSGSFLTMRLDELGWQVGIIPGLQGSYRGQENVETTDEATQAAIYAEVVRRLSCDRNVTDVLFFSLIDEPDLDRFQAGLVRADGTHRASYDAVKAAIAETQGTCTRRLLSWRHRTTVDGAAPQFGSLKSKPRLQRYWAFVVTADEDATYTAGLYRLKAGRTLSAQTRAVRRSLASASTRPVLTTRGTIKAYFEPMVRFPARRLPPGRYVYGIRVGAAMNPSRANVFLSRPFRVGGGRRGR